MDNIFDHVRAAVAQGKATQRAMEMEANSFADLLIDGNVRKLSTDRARQLKKLMAPFNLRTGRWSACK